MYPQPGDVSVRGVVEQLFTYGAGAGFLAGQIFGGVVRANWQDWEIPNASDMTYFYQSPLCFTFSENASVAIGDAVTFDIAENGGAVNIQPA